MITINARNAKPSEGKARIDEMADLKQPKPSTSNKKIISGMGGLFALLVYMRSFWLPQPAEGRAATENLREDAEEVYLMCPVPDISEWRAEIPQEIPADKPASLEDPEGMMVDRLSKIKSSGFFFQVMPTVNLSPLSESGPTMRATIPLSVDAGGGAPAPVASAAPGTPTGPIVPLNPVDPALTPTRDNPTVVDPEIVSPVQMTPPGSVTPVDQVDPAVPPSRDNPTVVDPEIVSPAQPTSPEPVTPEPPYDVNYGADPDCDCDADCGGTATAPTALKTVSDCDSSANDSSANDVCADDICAENTCAEDAALIITRVVVAGTATADTLIGTDAAEEIIGFAGADRIDGMAGDDVIIGGTEGDDLAGGYGDDALMGGDADDHLDGGYGADLVMGEAGDDVLDGGAGDDLLLGGAGADTIFGRDGNDRLVGDDGDDIVHDGRGRDVLLGGFGDDTIHLFADAEVDLVDGGDGFDGLDLTAAQFRSRTDIALGEVQLDDGPADLIVGVEAFVAGTATDEFDFSGLAAAKPEGGEPMFFQITNFGRGDMVRVTESFSIGFDDVADDGLWANTPDTFSELETRMRAASGDAADAVPSRLTFRTATEEGMVARVIDFDLDGDGQVDLALSIHGELRQDTPQFPDQA